MFRAFIIDSGERERETFIVIFEETIALQNFDDNHCLK